MGTAIAGGILHYGIPIAEDIGQWIGNQLWNENTEKEPCPESTPVKPPFGGEPGSTVQGKKQSREYGEDGKPLIDRDLPHPGGPPKEKEDHSHDWGPDGRGPARDPQPGDPPQPIGF